MSRHERIECGLRVEVIRCLANRDSRGLGQPGGGNPGELRVGVDAGADSRAAERNARELIDGRSRSPHRFLDLPGVALELLPEPDRGGVLEVRASGLDHRPELLALGFERLVQPLQRRDELILDRHRRGKLDRGRNDVVGGLAEVHVVVGVDEARTSLPAENLRRACRYDLVRVGVGRGARTGLINVDRELFVELAVDHLLGRGGDRACPAAREQAELEVGLSRRPLDQAESADETAWQRLAGDREVEYGALGRGAVVGVGRHLHLTH